MRRGRRAAFAVACAVAAVGALATPAPGHTQAQLPPDAIATIEETIGQAKYANSTWGIQVEDVATGEVLYSQNADLMFIPGSIMKNFATVSALAAYGTDYEFRTPVFKQGTVDDGELDGGLVLVASGDFSFGLRDEPDGTLAFTNFDHNEANNIPGVELVDNNPLSALNQLARDVKRSGIDRVSGDVVIDDRLFESYVQPDDGPITPIWVNENVIDLEIKPAEPGQAATLRWRPNVAPYDATADVETGEPGSETALVVDEGPAGEITVQGTIAADSPPVVRVVRVADPAAFARTAFIEALERAGVEVDATPTGKNPRKLLPSSRKYPSDDRVARHVSPPLSEYVKVIEKVSYNRGAAVMVCLLAVDAGGRKCLEDGIPPEVETITGLGVPPDGAFVFDGAGTDDYNRTSPAAMNAFLRGVVTQTYGSVFRDALPVLGVDGSLATTLTDSPAAGKVHAKTGTRATTTPNEQTILLAQTLTGYVTTASGRELVASAFMNNLPITDIEEVLDVFADEGRIMETLQQSL